MSSIQCTLASNETQTLYEFRPDATKKSAFWLDDDETGGAREAAAPAECRIGPSSARGGLPETTDASTTTAPLPQFYVGGFQLVSNAKMIEVYLNDDQYLTTCRGILSAEHRTVGSSDGTTTPNVDGAPSYYKAVFVVPGGPRQVRNVVLKLRSLVPKDQQVARLVMLKLTARLAPVAADPPSLGRPNIDDPTVPSATSPGAGPHPSLSRPLSVPTTTESLFTASVPGPATAAADAQDEVGRPPDADVLVQSAMAGLVLMIKGTEDRVIRSTTDTVRRELQTCFASMRTHLQGVSVSMTDQLNSIQRMVLHQQQVIESQQRMLHQLTEQQLELKQLLVERQVNQPVAEPPRDEEDVRGENEPVRVGEHASIPFAGGENANSTDLDNAVVDQEVTIGDSPPTEKAGIRIAGGLRTPSPDPEPASCHNASSHGDPEPSLDEVLARAFPIVSSSDGAAPAAATAAAAADPPSSPASVGPVPPVTTVMRVADLMDANAQDDDPFAECTIGPASSSPVSAALTP